jgi:hypothetical protein
MCNQRPPTEHNHPKTREGVRHVEQALAEYLRAWGLRDPKTIADHCGRWSGQAALPDADVAKWTQAALQQATREIEAWMDHLTHLAMPSYANIAAHRGMVALAMQAALKDYPEAFLSFDVPAELMQRLRERAASPVVPPADGDNQMSGPPLEELLPEVPSTHSHIYAVFVRLIGG